MKRYILCLSVATLSLTTLLHSAGATVTSAEKSNELFKIVSFNIDTNIGRTEEGYAREAYPEWRVGKRLPAITDSLNNLITTYAPDVIQI